VRLLIDGLWARDVSRTGGSHQGKRCTRYNHDFRHGTSSPSWKKQGSNLLSPLRQRREHERRNTSTVRQTAHVREIGPQCGRYETCGNLHPYWINGAIAASLDSSFQTGASNHARRRG
jgi:hypothetical protein